RRDFGPQHSVVRFKLVTGCRTIVLPENELPDEGVVGLTSVGLVDPAFHGELVPRDVERAGVRPRQCDDSTGRTVETERLADLAVGNARVTHTCTQAPGQPSDRIIGVVLPLP